MNEPHCSISNYSVLGRSIGLCYGKVSFIVLCYSDGVIKEKWTEPFRSLGEVTYTVRKLIPILSKCPTVLNITVKYRTRAHPSWIYLDTELSVVGTFITKITLIYMSDQCSTCNLLNCISNELFSMWRFPDLVNSPVHFTTAKKLITMDQFDFLPSTLSPTAASIVLDLYDIRNVPKSDFRMYGAQCENNDALTIKIR